MGEEEGHPNGCQQQSKLNIKKTVRNWIRQNYLIQLSDPDWINADKY